MSTDPQRPGQGPGDGASDPAAPDPSMEDILASIRRILNEEDGAAVTEAAGPAEPARQEPARQEPARYEPTRHEPAPPEPALMPHSTDVLELDPTMMIPEPEPLAPVASTPAPAPVSATDPMPPLVAPEAAAAAAVSVGALMRTLATERSTKTSRNGPTIEDLVREEVRPVLKEWLDAYLPPMVERLVRAEIERVVSRMT